MLSSLLPNFCWRPSLYPGGRDLIKISCIQRARQTGWIRFIPVSYCYRVPLASSDSIAVLNVVSTSLSFHWWHRWSHRWLTEIKTSTEETYIQLLQLSDYDRTRVQQDGPARWNCIIFYCGMHSYISAVQNDRRIYLQILSNTIFQRQVHEIGTLFLGGSAIISGASSNSIIMSSLTGSITMNRVIEWRVSE